MSYALVPAFYRHPDLVVMDVKDGIEQFYEDAVTMSIADYNVHDLVEALVKILGSRRTVEEEMMRCMEGIERCYGMKDGPILARAVSRLAQYLIEEFDLHDLWDGNGFLAFDFYDLRSRRLIMKRRHAVIEVGGYLPPP